MKNALLTLVFFSLLAFAASAQAPQAFKYQAVVRNAAGQVLANQSVSLRIRLTPADTTLTLYVETHTVTTNDFGLVNLEVGRGTVVSGQFGTIDWEQPVSIHLGLDVNGGAAYEEMGTSELLSVPYALYAANAAGGSGLPASPQTGDIVFYDGTSWQLLAAGAAGTVLTMGADGLPAWEVPPYPLDNLLKVTMTNGDVIYVSPVDQISNPPGVQWGFAQNIMALPDITTLADANMDFNGETNTAAIVAQLGDNNGTAYAAKVCADLVAYGFDDWYLPAAGELNEMYLKLGPNGSGQITTGNYYWSSSERSDSFAWLQNLGDGDQSTWFKFSSTQINGHSGCRCVRR